MSALKIAFLHPDLGIGGAERLVVDAALGLQALGHSVDIYTSHHDPNHCFEETIDGRLTVHNVVSPFPRAVKGKLHILMAHLRQLHLTKHILSSATYDVYFVDQLSTCVPILRTLAHRRVVFYCHFPDKLLANGEFVEGLDGRMGQKGKGVLNTIYRAPMDLLEEFTTGQADVILANSKFTARIFKSNFRWLSRRPTVVYPGINFGEYGTALDLSDVDILQVTSDRPTLLSLNRFEKKKNAALSIDAYAAFKPKSSVPNLRLVIAGGYDPRLEGNMMTLVSLIDRAKSHSLTFDIIQPTSTTSKPLPPFNTTHINPDVLFLLNFTTSQRSALLSAESTLVLLYTPTNEHFGIGPVEGMICGLPILACDTGGPTESVVDEPASKRTGWLRKPDAGLWAEALEEIVGMSHEERIELARCSKARAKGTFGMEAMAKGLETALRDAVAMGTVSSLVPWATTLLLLMSLLFNLRSYLTQ